MIVGICDDEQKCRDILVEYCDRIAAELERRFEYRQFSSGEEVLTSEEELEILLMDIEMDGINGIDTMKRLESYNNIKNIIFVSGYPEKVFEAFGLKTRAFIQKPVDYDKLAEEIKKIADRQKKSEIIEIVSLNRQVLLEVESIVYISGEEHYVRIVTENDEFFTYGTVMEWEEKLKEHDIIRVHKSYLINLKYVAQIDGSITFTIKDEKIPIGRKYRDEIKKRYKAYLTDKFMEEKW